MLIALSPLMLMVAIAIKLESEGPVFFKQVRIGKNRRSWSRRSMASRRAAAAEKRQSTIREADGEDKEDERRQTNLGKPFVLYKFRTMCVGANCKHPELHCHYETQDQEEIFFKVKEDPRRTRLGLFLSRSSMDELPNLFNVILGDMSMVGPRPEVREMLKYYKDDQRIKFDVRPGVTSLAKVNGRDELNLHETLEYDVEYVKKQSFLLDTKIFIKTIWVVLLQKGVY